MGKRRDRRSAAIMAAGRRVKLDLFAHPDPPGVSGEREVGGKTDVDQAEVPTSPSSGNKGENPLSLLGQYSDEESDENDADQHLPSGTANNDEIDAINGDCKNRSPAIAAIVSTEDCNMESDGKSNIAKESDSSTIRQIGCDVKENGTEMQITGELCEGWKVVMHEDSNQCYYWNTVTGETSWEMPNGLTPGGHACLGITPLSAVPDQISYPLDVQTHVILDNGVVAYQTDIANADLASGTYGLTVQGENVDVVGTHTIYAENLYPTSDAPVVACVPASDAERVAACYESTEANSSQVIRYGEALLERLKVLDGLRCSIDGLEWSKKEIEMRISDCKALSSYASSMLPFWWYVETQLKTLETSISKAEAACNDDPADKKPETALESESRDSHVRSPDVDPHVGERKIEDTEKDLEAETRTSLDNSSVGFVDSLPASTTENSELVQELVVAPTVESLDEDVDMDIEMNVDDENISEYAVSSSVPKSGMHSCEFIGPVKHSPAKSSSLSFAETGIPPPPDDECIPPPPPESEPVPPPPPDEPPASILFANPVPQMHSDSINLGYALPANGYFGAAVTEASNGCYFLQADAPYNNEQQTSSYYELPSVNPLPVPNVVMHFDPNLYYPIPTDLAAPPHGIVSSDPSVNTAASVLVSCDDKSAIKPEVLPVISGSAILPEPQIYVPLANSKDPVRREVSVSSSSQVLGSSTEFGGSAPASAINTNQTKVVRTKKRAVPVTSTLRSSKKVSLLVDKWKAVKEELNGEDDEPEGAYEVLERKRLREIEEWHAQQLASGEAKDNANFVPVRGDWRERVRRRKMETRKESSEDLKGSSRNGGTTTVAPDLTKYSRDLPSGWQAYWDESSKQVYYGNQITSETSWTRPT